jgi:hypothetical protein
MRNLRKRQHLRLSAHSNRLLKGHRKGSRLSRGRTTPKGSALLRAVRHQASTPKTLRTRVDKAIVQQMPSQTETFVEIQTISSVSYRFKKLLGLHP